MVILWRSFSSNWDAEPQNTASFPCDLYHAAVTHTAQCEQSQPSETWIWFSTNQHIN